MIELVQIFFETESRLMSVVLNRPDSQPVSIAGPIEAILEWVAAIGDACSEAEARGIKSEIKLYWSSNQCVRADEDLHVAFSIPTWRLISRQICEACESAEFWFDGGSGVVGHA